MPSFQPRFSFTEGRALGLAVEDDTSGSDNLLRARRVWRAGAVYNGRSTGTCYKGTVEASMAP